MPRCKPKFLRFTVLFIGLNIDFIYMYYCYFDFYISFVYIAFTFFIPILKFRGKGLIQLNRIRLLRLRNNLKQEELCKIINVSQASLSGYENGKFEPDNKTLMNLAAYFGVTTDYLLGNDLTKCVKTQTRRIPVLRYYRSENSAEYAEEIERYEDIGHDMAKQGEYFALKVHGDSMEPRIQDGDIVIVRKQKEIENGDVAVVTVGDSEASVKKIVKYEGGITLIPYNPKYDPVPYTKEEMKNLPVIIVGKAIELRGKC